MTVLRGVNWAMCGLFLVAVAVQWNDPDPARWVAIYGAALAASLMVALGRRLGAFVPAMVGVVALVWGLMTIVGGPVAAQYAHMFDAWKMESAPVEQAREAIGLLIVAVWMAVLAAAQRGRRKG